MTVPRTANPLRTNNTRRLFYNRGRRWERSMGLGAYYAFFGQDEIAFGKCIFAQHVYVFYTMQQVSDKPSSQQQHNNKKTHIPA